MWHFFSRNHSKTNKWWELIEGEEEVHQEKVQSKVDTSQAFNYEELEESEFDDNCIPGCRPGEHKCGKNNG